MAIISRGFSGRRTAANPKLPPGQYITTDFPVLSAGPTEHVPLDQWEFVVDDGASALKRWNWKSFRDLPAERVTADIHCVTRWSKFGTSWEGVSLDTLLADIRPMLGTRWCIRMAAIARTCHWRISRTIRHGSCSGLMAKILRLSTAVLRACSFRTFISGRARSGFGG